MTRCNDDIRRMMQDAGLYQWQIADKINMSESNFYRVMRHDLKPDIRERVLKAIAELKGAAV